MESFRREEVAGTTAAGEVEVVGREAGDEIRDLEAVEGGGGTGVGVRAGAGDELGAGADEDLRVGGGVATRGAAETLVDGAAGGGGGAGLAREGGKWRPAEKPPGTRGMGSTKEGTTEGHSGRRGEPGTR